jgi:hypothetical protein
MFRHHISRSVITFLSTAVATSIAVGHHLRLQRCSVTCSRRCCFTSFSICFNTSSIGFNSFSIGFSTSSFGFYSFSIGFSTSSIGFNSFSIGFNTSSIGFYSFSIGFSTFVFFGNRLLLSVFNTHFPPLVFLADVGSVPWHFFS